MPSSLISVSWLQNHLDDKNIVLLDASSAPNGLVIENALRFDIKNTFSDRASPLPNTLPSASQFEVEARKLGISSDSHIIIYDAQGIFTSPRAWWLFTIMGHSKVSILDGGLPAWSSHNLPLKPYDNTPKSLGNFKANFNTDAVTFYNDILENVSKKSCNLIDARSAGRFSGNDPEPRAHLQSGHIPNSYNLPYSVVLDNGSFKSKDDLKRIFQGLTLDEKPIIFSCGSGITACILLFAYQLISNKPASIYDGSWTEYAENRKLYTT